MRRRSRLVKARPFETSDPPAVAAAVTSFSGPGCSPYPDDAEGGEDFLGPVLQVSVVAPFGIALEERDRALVSVDLHRIVFAPEIGWRGGVQFVDLFLNALSGAVGKVA